MFFNKKGVSPLIATVLLIAFAVALGAVVMNWGKDFVTSKMDSADRLSNLDLSCSNEINLAIKTINDQSTLCYQVSGSDKNISFMLQNTGTKDIDGIKIVVIDATGDNINITSNTSFIISAGSIKKGVIPVHNFSISQIEFIPMMKVGGERTAQLCAKNSLIETSVPEC